MSVRSLNKVMLIGNLTRDPELRYTPSGTAVCSFGLATNRSWTTDSGEKREEAEFHKIVAWNKLAELCSQLLTKGRKVFVEGRLQTRSWQAADQTQRTSTEIVIEDMIILDSRKVLSEGAGLVPVTADVAVSEPVVGPAAENAVYEETASPAVVAAATDVGKKKKKEITESTEKKTEGTEVSASSDDINPDDIPF